MTHTQHTAMYRRTTQDTLLECPVGAAEAWVSLSGPAAGRETPDDLFAPIFA